MYRSFATAAALAAAVCTCTAIFCAATFPLCATAQQKQIPPELNGHANVAEIVLPPELETEKPATLAVVDSDGLLVEGVTVLLPGGRKVTTDGTGRARFVVTSEPGAFIAEVAAGALQPRVRAYSQVLAHPLGNSPPLALSEYPRILVHDQPAAVLGNGFRGDAEFDSAVVGGKPAMILAASPMGIVFQTAHDSSVGPANLVLSVAGAKREPLAVTIVSLEIRRPSSSIVVGNKDEMFARVTGTEQKIMLAVENRTPDVIELTDGNFHWVMSSGGVLNEAAIGFRARNGGEFSVSVRVARNGSAAAPDLNLVRRELLAAQGLAESEWVGRTERVMVRMDQAERSPKNIGKLRQELEKMLTDNAPPDVNRHLQAAWLELSQP
jgi:hypothetical protein